MYLILLLIFFYTSYSQIQRYEINYSGKELIFSESLFRDELLFNTELNLNKFIKKYGQNLNYDKSKLLEIDLNIIEGNLILANQMLDNLIKDRYNSPLLPIFIYRQGLVLLELEDYNKSYNEFEQAKNEFQTQFDLRNDSSYFELKHNANYYQAISYALAGKYLESEEIFKEVAFDPIHNHFSDDALFALGQIQEFVRKYQASIDYYREVRIRFPFSNCYLRALVREANNHLALRQATNAIDLLERSNTIWNHIIAEDSIGNQYEKQDKLEAIHQEILYLKGESANLLENYNEAISYFSSFLGTYTDSNIENLVKLGLAWAYLNLNRLDESEKVYNSIVAGKPDIWQTKDLANLYIAVVNKKKGNLATAKTQFAELALNSDYKYLGEVLLELGQIYYEEKNWESAKRTLERADREAIDVASTCKIFILLGAVYLELKQYQKAIDYYDKVENIVKNISSNVLPKKDWYYSELRFKRALSYMFLGKSNYSVQDLLAFIATEKNDKRLEDALYWLAESYYKKDAFLNAQQTYQNILLKYPRTDKKEDILYGLAWSYFKQADLNNAQRYFGELVDQFPNSEYKYEIYARIGDAYFLQKKFNLAVDNYSKVSKGDPISEEGQYCTYQMSSALYRLGKFEEAMNSFQNFVVRFPNSKLAPNALYHRGWIRLQQGRFAESISIFEYLIDAFPNSGYVATTNYSIATAYYNDGDYDKAINKYKEIVEKYPSSDLAQQSLKNIEQALYILGKTDEYIEFVDAYTGKNENSPFVYDFKSSKANTLFSSGRYQEAAKEFESLIEQFPNKEDNAEALYWIGRSYISMEQVSQVDNTFKMLISKYPNNQITPKGIISWADMYSDLDELKKSDSIYNIIEKNYNTDPNVSEAAYKRALLMIRMGDTTNAKNQFIHTFVDYPINEFGLESGRVAAEIFKRKENNDSAIVLFEKIASQDFDKRYAAEALFNIGVIYKKQKKYDSAIQTFNNIRENYTGFEDYFSDALINLGEIYEQRKEWILAKEIYNILIELRPDDEYGETAKNRLKRIKN